MDSATPAFAAPATLTATRAFRALCRPRRGPARAAARETVRAVRAPAAAPQQRTVPQRGAGFVVTVHGGSGAGAAAAEAVVHAHDGMVHSWRALGPEAQEAVATLPLGAGSAVRDALRALSGPFDCSLQAAGAVHGGKRLAVFDLDSTLIAEETIDELAQEHGVADRVRAITVRAMRGEVGFRDALRARVGLLRGLDVSALDRVRARASLTPGARDLVAALRAQGCRTAVVSGGFRFLAEHVRDVLGIDYAFSNSLEVQDGALTGRTIGPIVDGEFKRDTLLDLAERLDIPRAQVLAVGDGSNDVLMIQAAGLGVAFNAKPKLQQAAHARVNDPSLRPVLYLLGLDDAQIETLVAGSAAAAA